MAEFWPPSVVVRCAASGGGFFVGWLDLARPSSYTREKGKQVIAELEAGQGVSRAAKAVKVTRKTIYNWADANEEFGEAFEETQEAVTDAIESTLIQKALSGDVTAGIFMLKSRRRAIYGDKQQLEHTGANGSPFTVVIEKPT